MARSRHVTLVLLALIALGGAASAGPREVLDAVVGVRAEVPAEARTAATLGRERHGSGVVIDADGLVVTIGYLILEASAVDLWDADGRRVPATVVGYDHETGFGLLRATTPLEAQPVPLGDSRSVRIGDPLLIVSRVGELGGRESKLVDRREFAGYWEYLLPEALFTTPPFPAFAGAALIDVSGRLIGIGSLSVGDAAGTGLASPGNMFVPTGALPPILGELLAFGRRERPGRPWLGLYSRELGGHVVVTEVAREAPAAAAGIETGDLIVGVGARPVTGLADFYRQVWAQGGPGVVVPLRVIRGREVIEVPVTSSDRLRWLRLRQSY